MASSIDVQMDNSPCATEMLTPMDVSSDTRVGKGSESPGLSRPTRALHPINALSKLIESDTESEHDEARAQIPRTKLVARLQPQKLEVSSESEEEQDDGDAYERVKAMLMSNTGRKEPHPEPQIVSKSTKSMSSGDEDDSPVRTNARRAPAQRQKSSSPRVSHSPAMRSRQSSPGLFVSPEASPIAKKVPKSALVAEDSDDSTRSELGKDLEERVERIRAERRARQQKEQEQERRKKLARRQIAQDSDSDPDGENGRRLTQQARPTRRAGKKAMEDIAREQQRISRNMQLAHQSKTKKKYSTKDLLARFGLHQETAPVAAMPTPDASSVLASSDVEVSGDHDTPPTSPPSQEDLTNKADGPTVTTSLLSEHSIAVNPMLTPASPPPPKLNKGKGRAPEYAHLPANPLVKHSQPVSVRNAGLENTQPVAAEMVELSDSDEDIKPIQSKSRFPVFDRLRAQKKQQEAPSLLHLRHLAHLTSPGKKAPKGKKSMNTTELQFSLASKIQLQVQKERQERIEELKRRGIHIETEEERERHQLEIEDMVAQFEKARAEDMKLAKLEREEAKKNGETGDGLLSSDDSEDDDYVGSGGEEAAPVDEVEEDADMELSGSEEEGFSEADDEGELDEEEAGQESHGLVNDAAEEDDDEEEGPESMEETDTLDNEEDMEDDVLSAPARKPTMNRTRKVIIDDDDESADEDQRSPTTMQTHAQPSQTQHDDGMAAFGFNDAGATLKLTQMFAGTMANMGSDSQSHPLDKEPEQDSLDFLRSLPDTQPSNMFSQDVGSFIPNSQPFASHQNESQSRPTTALNLGISQLMQSSPGFTHTQLSEVPEPTQDAGFELSRSPAGLVPPPSTVDTVMMSIAESPLVKRKGKLRQHKRIGPTEPSDVDEDLTAAVSNVEQTGKVDETGNAFAVLKKGAKKQKRIADNFDKKTSWARDAIEEQAEESEDEYAGIGGASDEDSGEEDEELAKMIDTSEVKVDERKLAAYYAEKDKADDEKNINQLYKDLLNGGLRKRRGGDAFGLSDSEDETEQRRRKKQQEFRQMTKALISDERIAKLNDNPKKAAFFHTLADHMDDPEYDFLNAPELEPETSQSQDVIENKEGELATDIAIPDSQTNEMVPPVNPLKRKATDSQGKENRPPPHMRRTAASDNLSRKPITLLDIQHSVSELLEDPNIMVPDSQFSESDSELEVEPPTSQLATTRKPIIDRLTLSREASLLETTVDVNGNMAFVAPSAGMQPGFRIPSLIRRATSNLSAVSTTSSGASTPVEGSGVRRGGTGRSNIHAQAREAERRAALEKVEKKRKESLKKKVGKARGKRSVLGCLDGGFE